VTRELGVDTAQDVESATDVAAHGSLDGRIGVGLALLTGQARNDALGRAEEVVGRDGAAQLRGDLGDLTRGVDVVAVAVLVVAGALTGVAVVVTGALAGVAVVVLGRLDLDALGRIGVDGVDVLRGGEARTGEGQGGGGADHGNGLLHRASPSVGDTGDCPRGYGGDANGTGPQMQ